MLQENLILNDDLKYVLNFIVIIFTILEDNFFEN